jgi:kynureninase
LRSGFTPLYTRLVDVWDAVQQLEQVMQSGQWQHPPLHNARPSPDP